MRNDVDDGELPSFLRFPFSPFCDDTLVIHRPVPKYHVEHVQELNTLISFALRCTRNYFSDLKLFRLT